MLAVQVLNDVYVLVLQWPVLPASELSPGLNEPIKEHTTILASDARVGSEKEAAV